MSVAQKLGHERFIFNRFCAPAGLDIVEGSVEQPLQDPPDLRANLKSYGQTAFELVRLNDRDALKAKNRVVPGTILFMASFADLGAERRATLTAKFADCALTISFCGTENDADRRDALTFLWKLLEELPAEHEGQVQLARFKAPAALTWLYITHTFGRDGPHLQSFGSGGEFPLDLDQLRKKLVTPYSRSERLELLAYIDSGEIAHLGATERIADLVVELLPQSSFHTVWIYEGLLDRVAFAVCRASRSVASARAA